MTRRERLLRCYYNQEVDRPAVYSRTGFPNEDPSYNKLKNYLQDYSELKIIWDGAQFDSNYPIDRVIEPHSENFERCREVLHTPRGELRRSSFVSLKGQPGLHETYFINSREDAEKYLSLPIPEIKGNVSSFFAANNQIGDKGIVSIQIGFNPGGFTAELCGSENFAVMSKTDRDILHCLCERQAKIISQRIKFLVERNVGPFFEMLGEEYIVPPLHGLEDFYDFNVKYDKHIIDLIHNAGGRMHIHCHGSVKSIFKGFIDMGADVLHPFEPPPQGNISPREAKTLARNLMCLEGNIQINRMYEASPQDIRQETEQLIDEIFDDNKGLIVCPTASPYIFEKGEQCFPQYKALIDTVRHWKG